jgi:nucleotide-binding universal stress UspA family protein
MAAERLIVVGVDGSDDGRRALAWAVDHARHSGATVQVVTAYTWLRDWAYGVAATPDDQRRQVAERLDADIEAVLRGRTDAPEISRMAVEGDPVEVLTRAAAGADMMVLGSHGHGAVASALLGSTATGCIRHGTTPVLVVPGRVAADRADSVIPTARPVTA